MRTVHPRVIPYVGPVPSGLAKTKCVEVRGIADLEDKNELVL
jgi:hypothetical protein